MKRSIKIIFGLITLLALAVTFGMLAPENPEGVLGLALIAPIAIGMIETSAEAKQLRKDVWDEMQGMIETRKTEKRGFTKAEEQKYSDLQKRFDELTARCETLEADELRALRIAGKVAQQMMTGVNQPDQWFDATTKQPIKVYQRGEQIADGRVQPGTFGRIIRGIVTGDWQGVPSEYRTALSTSNTGTLVPSFLWGSVIDKSRAKSVLWSNGALTVEMPGNTLVIARVKTDGTMEVKAENEAFSDNAMQFEPLTLKAWTVGALITLSNELIQDSPNAGLAIEQALAAALAAEVDRLGLFGLGTTQPTGIFNLTGVEEATGANKLDWSHVIDAWTKVAENNGNPATLAGAPRDIAAVQSKLIDSGYLARPELLKDLKIAHSSVFPTDGGTGSNESQAVVGDFTQCIIGVRQSITVEASAVAGDTFAKNQTAIRVVWRGDIGYLKPGHFAKITGITNVSA